jgi:hypothetical protein
MLIVLLEDEQGRLKFPRVSEASRKINAIQMGFPRGGKHLIAGGGLAESSPKQRGCRSSEDPFGSKALIPSAACWVSLGTVLTSLNLLFPGNMWVLNNIL